MTLRNKKQKNTWFTIFLRGGGGIHTPPLVVIGCKNRTVQIRLREDIDQTNKTKCRGKNISTILIKLNKGHWRFQINNVLSWTKNANKPISTMGKSYLLYFISSYHISTAFLYWSNQPAHMIMNCIFTDGLTHARLANFWQMSF